MAGISGLLVNDDLKEIVKEIFDSKSPIDWSLFMFDGDAALKAEYVGDDWFGSSDNFEKDWNDLLAYLPENEVRYLVVDFKYLSPNDNIERSKRIFVMWAPEYAPQKEKLMVTMYSKDVQNKLCGGSVIYVQANELSDISYQRVLDKINSSCYCF